MIVIDLFLWNASELYVDVYSEHFTNVTLKEFNFSFSLTLSIWLIIKKIYSQIQRMLLIDSL